MSDQNGGILAMTSPQEVGILGLTRERQKARIMDMPSFNKQEAMRRGAFRAGAAARVTNRYPLRRIVGEEGSRERLDCGHLIDPPTVWFGRAVSPAPGGRRRCHACSSDPNIPQQEGER